MIKSLFFCNVVQSQCLLLHLYVDNSILQIIEKGTYSQLISTFFELPAFGDFCFVFLCVCVF